MALLKIDLLVKRIHELNDKKNEFKQELIDTKRMNIELVKEKAVIEEINDDLGL